MPTIIKDTIDLKPAEMPSIVPETVTALKAGSFFFALDRVLIAAALRELADAVESGDLLPQQFVRAEISAIDDFTMQQYSLKVAPRNKRPPVEEKIVRLPHQSGFPAAVAKVEADAGDGQNT